MPSAWLSMCLPWVVLPSALLSFWYAGLVIAGAIALCRWRPLPPASGEAPSVSVLIPAHNEAAVIERTLTALAVQDHGDYEVIVIDDHSTDGTAALARARDARTLSLTGGRPLGKSEALNAGLAIARGDAICVLDADARIAPDFLRLGAAALASPGVCAVQARLRIDNPDDSLWTALQADELGILNDCVEAARTRLGGATRVLGNGQFVRRDALSAIGGWRPGLVDDLDLTLRLVLARQGRIVFAPEVVVWQEAVPTLGALVRQRARWFEGHLRAAGTYAARLVTTREMPFKLKLDMLLCLASVATPLLGAVSLLAQMSGVFHATSALGPLSAGLFLAGFLAVGAVGRRLEGAWRWRPAFTYALLMPVFLLALLRALGSLATGGARRWDKTARTATPLESRP